MEIKPMTEILSIRKQDISLIKTIYAFTQEHGRYPFPIELKKILGITSGNLAARLNILKRDGVMRKKKKAKGYWLFTPAALNFIEKHLQKE